MSKKPMVDRCWAGLLVLLAHAPLLTAEEPSGLTARETLERASERPELAHLRAAAASLGQAERGEARIRPNPVLEAGHERNAGAPFDESETTVKLSQRLDLSGERRFRIQAADERAQALAHRYDAERSEFERTLLKTYFEWVLQSQRAALLGTLDSELSALAQTLERRVAAGQSSEYDLARLRTYTAQIQAQRSVARSRELEAGNRLHTLAGLHHPVVPTTPLLPPGPPEQGELLDRLSEAAEIRRLERGIAALEREVEAERRAAIPDVELGIGTRRIEAGEFDDTGLIATFEVELPVFDRRQAPRARAEALRQEAEARLSFERERLRLDALGRLTLWRDSRRAYLAAMAESLESAQRTVRLAYLAFDGGELDLFQLLDALRNLESISRDRLELAWQARQAAIDLYPITQGALE